MASASAGGILCSAHCLRDRYPFTAVRLNPLAAQWYLPGDHELSPSRYRAYNHHPGLRHPHSPLSPPIPVCPSDAASTATPAPQCSCYHRRWYLPSKLLVSMYRSSHQFWPWPTLTCHLPPCQRLYSLGPSSAGGLQGAWGSVGWVYQSVMPPYIRCIEVTCQGNPCSGYNYNSVASIIEYPWWDLYLQNYRFEAWVGNRFQDGSIGAVGTSVMSGTNLE